ncbi:sensor histidine kinase [Nocardia jinanensis]|uniref:histidine kinase n=1 Tax=Nocardia jinanensis TaxID=382504 RepID=A0A917VYJ3_9NOCA|nr:histidine kinase [Nocardia jinanensis]GGL38481.1 two-component sensor histidine kinase [Nocardia jinanensis]
MSIAKPANRRRGVWGLIVWLGLRWWLDAVSVLTAVTLFSVAWPTLHLTHQVPWPIAPLIAAFAALPVLLMRANALLGWAVSAASALFIALAVPNLPDQAIPFQVVHIVALYFLMFAVALRSPPQLVAVVWGATSLLLGAALSAEGIDADPWAWPVSLGGLVFVALLLRSLIRSRSELNRQTEVSDLERARRTILEEKARIARDLHDVVAHHMSLVVVQAQTAPYRVEGVNDAARAEFESIGATAREALNEIRGLLGVLRSDGQLAEHAPQPTATDLEALFVGAARAGVDLTWSVDGTLAAIPDTVGSALYRIVQESLANTGRHAPGAPVRVTIVCAADVELTVVNGAGTGTATGGTGGHGIPGMQARALAVGGRLDAAPALDGGFRVHARLPLALATEFTLPAAAGSGAF